jgi:hypothetical protein
VLHFIAADLRSSMAVSFVASGSTSAGTSLDLFHCRQFSPRSPISGSTIAGLGLCRRRRLCPLDWIGLRRHRRSLLDRAPALSAWSLLPPFLDRDSCAAAAVPIGSGGSNAVNLIYLEGSTRLSAAMTQLGSTLRWLGCDWLLCLNFDMF